MLGWAQAFGRASRRMGNRGVLSPKRGNHGFYKGKGSRKEGRHTIHGAFVVSDKKVMEIVVPDGLATTTLKPYVAWDTVPPKTDVQE